MASEGNSSLTPEIESDISDLLFLSNGYLVSCYIHIACSLNLAGIIGETGQPLSLNAIAEKIPGEVNLGYLKRYVHNNNNVKNNDCVIIR